MLKHADRRGCGEITRYSGRLTKRVLAVPSASSSESCGGRASGLGDAKAVRVKAALELGRRLAARSPEERPPVGSSEDVANLLGIEMAALEQEQLRVVLLDTKHRILGTRTIYQGSVNQAQVRVADSARTVSMSKGPQDRTAVQ